MNDNIDEPTEELAENVEFLDKPNFAKPNSKTPLYQAMNSDRYHRQELIRHIQNNTKRRLICFLMGKYASIDRDDTLGFVELLHNVDVGADLDLLLHTGGGDIDAAEKLISLVRSKVGNGSLRIIVPDMAKSAGTLMALGADKIVMSDSSELGPIDPQMTLSDGNGYQVPHSVQNYLDAYAEHSAALKEDDSDVVAHLMLKKIDPATIKRFVAARARALKCAENLLKLSMCKNNGTYTKIASELIDTTRWLTHGQMIDHQAASSMGLAVEYLEPKDAQWCNFWQLYCLQRLAIKANEKLYESDYASITVDGLAA